MRDSDRILAVQYRIMPNDGGVAAIPNPDWTRDELIVALEVYLRYRPNPPGKTSHEIRKLSESLRELGKRLFREEDRANTFRNRSGVYMKLMNFRRLDPNYTTGGKTGLARGAKADKEVWDEFANDPARCSLVAKAILDSLNSLDAQFSSLEAECAEGIQDAAEGRLLTRIHHARERNRALVRSKHKQAIKQQGKLQCEACGFDFAERYGDRAEGFIECHHTQPLATLPGGHKTKLTDLALVCANCHRVIHRGRKWLSVDELRGIIRS